MHPSFQQRIDELGALLLRTDAARSELFRKADRIAPAKRVRFQVITQTGGSFHIVDLFNGKNCGFRFTYEDALGRALQLEAKADRKTIGPRVLQ
jgi:hypothetical protein